MNLHELNDFIVIPLFFLTNICGITGRLLEPNPAEYGQGKEKFGLVASSSQGPMIQNETL